MVTIISSPIPVMPLPIAVVQPQMLKEPVKMPISPHNTVPPKSTTITFTPITAAANTTKYGNTFTHEISPGVKAFCTPLPIKI